MAWRLVQLIAVAADLVNLASRPSYFTTQKWALILLWCSNLVLESPGFASVPLVATNVSAYLLLLAILVRLILARSLETEQEERITSVAKTDHLGIIEHHPKLSSWPWYHIRTRY